MQVGDRKLIVVGDRVLVRPEDGESVTNTGLILPASVADREEVQTGRVVSVGPGQALPPSGLGLDEEEGRRSEPRWVSMQAKAGDLAVYSRKAAVDIVVEGDKLVVVPHGAILVLLRQDREAAEGTVN